MGRQCASAQAAPAAMLGGMKILVKWLLCAAALLGVAYVYSGVQVQSFGSAMIAALVIGLLNTIIRPILVVLTLPVTIVTVGLFLLVVNGLMFWMASGLLGGFHVAGFWAAMLGALIYSVLGLLIDRLVAQLFPE
ncbi:hypothetical protein DJFAAGMI_03616 [Comamonas sp. PE63]|uniref:Phage holin family protein n=1 Tax=Comamonas brasiliensis TaxID=1812482 RepID=A0ABS5LX15_9BURK|nr:hypothetical protein [Comamonas sp. PE63]